MLKWALIFLIIAVVAGIFGFTNVEAASATLRNGCSGYSWCCSLAR
jgi:Mg2+ and Co2+ transporter CorA